MPHTYQQKHTATSSNGQDLDSCFREFDCSRTLSIFSYYALVVFSFTGLLTLLRRTKFLVGREVSESVEASKHIVAESNPILMVEPYVFDYIRKEQSIRQGTTYDARADFIIKRRFEYDFAGFLSVLMIHLKQVGQDTTHLVEVYKIQNPILRLSFSAVLKPLSWVLRKAFPLSSSKSTSRKPAGS